MYKIIASLLLTSIVLTTKSYANLSLKPEELKALSKFRCSPVVDIKNFSKNTSKFLNQRPIKLNSKCQPIDRPINFQKEEWMFSMKNNVRDKIINKKYEENKSNIRQNDWVEDLVDNRGRIIRNIYQMDTRNLTEGEIANSPWSDSYWPFAQGLLGFRYDEMDYDLSWHDLYKYQQKNPASYLIKQGMVNKLSPSEKYDLLVGDHFGTLTQTMWKRGKEYFEEDGEVPEWMGICDGWAAASYMLPRPKKAVTMTAADGHTPITFYPSDIKALGSLLWAEGESWTNFIGERCDIKEPRQDPNGRILNQDCFDTNPGTWHMAIVNQIGISKRSFIMDATYDHEVWNQPIVDYSYTYFNPRTMEYTDDIDKAIIRLNRSFRQKDVFRKYRSRRARYLVGIYMEVTYLTETDPSTRDHDDESYDEYEVVTYQYDLELNSRGRIIGGEWYNNAHPDFLWTPIKNTKAKSFNDDYIYSEWNGRGTVPAEWRELAQGSYNFDSASAYGQPLGKIVEKLFEKASR